jgi:hypothetical protein
MPQVPSDTDDISCHLQQIGMGTLICRAAKQTGDGCTNEVDPSICFNCDAGNVFREVGCDAALPKIRIRTYFGGAQADLESLFCRMRKRDTTLEYCRTCNLANAETTKEIVSTARGLFAAQGLHSAYKDLEKARERIRDGDFDAAITSSISCLESTLRECHHRLGQPLPDGKQVSDLWKSARSLLKFADVDGSGRTEIVLNSLGGLVTNLGGLRNTLSDAHGRDSRSPAASEAIAELALNTAATIATAAVRRLNQLTGSSQ